MLGLDWALTHLANLLRLLPEQLQARHLDGSCVALRYLIEDIRLPSGQEQRDLSTTAGPIPVSDRPRYRALSTSLAARLATRYSDMGQPMPEILGRWKYTSSSDAATEIGKGATSMKKASSDR